MAEQASHIWEPSGVGVLGLPSGRLIRGRALRRPPPEGPNPAFGVYLLGHGKMRVPWETRQVRWRDFWLPSDPDRLSVALHEAWSRSATERVEVACAGGQGRTGTALACLAVLDGVPGSEAVAYVRARYLPRATELPWQRRFVANFERGDGTDGLLGS